MQVITRTKLPPCGTACMFVKTSGSVIAFHQAITAILFLVFLLYSQNSKGREPNVKGAKETFVLSGTILDEKDEGLPGASVRVKGTNKGVVTDIRGKFLIEVEPTDSVTISFVGYKTKTIIAGSQKVITIKLEPDLDDQKLNEVQVVGFGTQKKTTLVGSVSSVSVKEIQKFSTPSLTNAIGGKLAGVVTRQTSGEPGYDAAKIFIRGLVSQSGVNKPLIIVDGAERELQDYWTTMNIQEIETFSVLKDASATAVYGNRGANGVILITTKRGTLGVPKVTLRSEFAVVTPMRIEDNINAYEYASLINESRANIDQGPKYSDIELQKYKNQSDPYVYPDVNWYDVVFRNHTKQMINNLGISGGTEAVKYYVNLGYTIQEGIYNEDPANSYKTNASLKRYNFRSNVDMKLTNRFSVELGLSGIMSGANFPGTAAGRIFDVLKLTTPLAYAIKNPDGSNPGASGDSEINPYTLITQTGYTRQFYNTIVSNLAAKWDLSSITQGLSARGLAAFDVVDITQNVRQKRPATFFYQKDAEGKDTYKPIVTETALGLYNLNETYKTLYGELALSYDRSFGKHSVSGLLLANRREYINVNSTNSITNLPERRQGLVGRITYNYDTRYLLEINAGYNGSENFPKGKQYGLFPSIGAGWLVSNEAFWNKNIISSLKLRGSYGLVGNDRIGGDRFLFQTTFNKSAPGYVFGLGQNIDPGGKSEARIGNENVTWERAYKSNAGFDLELFNGKFTLTADAFHERRNGQLLVRGIIPIYTGYPGGTIPYGNVGVSTNKGIDGTLQIRNTTSGGFYYSFTGTFTFAKNKIIENDRPAPLYPWQDLRGYPIGSNLGYEAIGFFKDQTDIDNSPSQTYFQSVIRPGDVKYRDIDNDGKITNADQTVIGKYGSEPQVMYGFGTTLAWKGFDATIFFTGAARRDFFFTQQWTAWPFAYGEGAYNVMQKVYDNRWIPGADNTKAEYPAVRSLSKNNYLGSTIYKEIGDYLRIKNAEIGYTLPTAISKKIAMNSVRIFAQGTNLATWDHIKVIDPESNFGTGSYPTTRNFNFGLEVTF